MKRFVVIAMLLAVAGCGSEEERAAKTCVDSGMAWVMAQKYVRNNLSTGRSASFPALPVAAEHVSGCSHAIVGDFEAQNGFGATVKRRFSATLTYNKSDNTWTGRDLTIQ